MDYRLTLAQRRGIRFVDLVASRICTCTSHLLVYVLTKVYTRVACLVKAVWIEGHGSDQGFSFQAPHFLTRCGKDIMPGMPIFGLVVECGRGCGRNPPVLAVPTSSRGIDNDVQSEL